MATSTGFQVMGFEVVPMASSLAFCYTGITHLLPEKQKEKWLLVAQCHLLCALQLLCKCTRTM